MASGGSRRKPRGGSSSRPKAKKRTKYLSLSRIIIKAEVESPEDHEVTEPWDQQAEVKTEEDGKQHQHAEPFALHHETASTLFAACPAPSLSDILGASATGAAGEESPSASPAEFHGAEEEDLARRALRGRERWVYCCSSTSSPSTTTTTATSSSSPCSSAASTGATARSLLLKLDYDDILAAWADRGSLYIAHAAPKQEPETDLDNVLVEVEPPYHPEAAAVATMACAWSATPETAGWSGRAESVRRYKEKRRNRLFAHRIRYEVRRVNAVRRPRFKGRFIKEHED